MAQANHITQLSREAKKNIPCRYHYEGICRYQDNPENCEYKHLQEFTKYFQRKEPYCPFAVRGVCIYQDNPLMCSYLHPKRTPSHWKENKPPAIPDKQGTTDDCCICQDETSDKIYLKPCGHSEFHIECIQRWMQRSPTCPLCRRVAAGVYKK